MIKVITYGTYDLLHYGHINLLKRAKALGDYLIVGVTADDFDKSRGKINVKQSLMERIEAVKATGLVDEVIVEEYEGQKIDDIRRHDVDIFTVGSDWRGHFDYLEEYCQVIYLERTKGISSSELRGEERKLNIGMIGEMRYLKKFLAESKFVNGIQIAGVCSYDESEVETKFQSIDYVTKDIDNLLDKVDAVYIISHPRDHYEQIKKALLAKKHVLCEMPIALRKAECEELFELAEEQGCVLVPAVKTAYATAYNRLLLLVKGGNIGKIKSIDVTCTSLENIEEYTSETMRQLWNSIYTWGPVGLLPIFQLLGADYKSKCIISQFVDEEKTYDSFTKVDFIYPHAVASIKVGKGIKAEGEMVISGTKGYIYVPAPWWKTDYFEIRYEDARSNKRYFYQLDGEGIRYEIAAFAKSVEKKEASAYIEKEVAVAVSDIMESYIEKSDLIEICD